MGKSTPKAPTPPDPVATAAAQTQSNRDTAITQARLNNVNQVTPYGNLTYQQTGTAEDGTPQFTATTSFSPSQQQLFDINQDSSIRLGNLGRDAIDRAGGILGRDVDFSGAPAQTTQIGVQGLRDFSGPVSFGQIQTSVGPDDFSADRQRVEDALFQRLSPQLSQRRAELEQQLINQGVTPGSGEAWNRGIDDYNRQENDLRLATVARAGDEQSRLFGMALQRGQFANAAQAQGYSQAADNASRSDAQRQQEFANQFNLGQINANLGNQGRQQFIQEEMLKRQTPLNEISALLSGTQVQSPQFVNTPGTQVSPTDVMGAYNTQYQGQLNNYNQQMAARNSALGGLFGLGGALGGAWIGR
jgi:hypothetical protein